jgi:imidazolonepropionase-like amidohydrolase
MSPLDALRAATTISADLFGIASRTGRIQSGFEADLIVLERNPLEDIRTVHDILIVINNGVIAARKGDWPPDRT